MISLFFHHRVCFLAGELLRAIKERQPEANITDNDILCVEIAALCHDLGKKRLFRTDGLSLYHGLQCLLKLQYVVNYIFSIEKIFVCFVDKFHVIHFVIDSIDRL